MESIPEISSEIRERIEEFRSKHKTGVLTLLFSDVVGSTALKQRLGDSAGTAGIIHRDVKPSNILVSGRGDLAVRAKLTDFGIGQIVSKGVLQDITGFGFTETSGTLDSSQALGTRLYMAPEVLAGKPSTNQSDIYSLGVILFQLVVGDFQRPVTGDWRNDVEDPILKEDLEKCLAGEPVARFDHIGGFVNDL